MRGANVEVGYLTRVKGLESGSQLRVVVIPLKVSSVVSPGEGGPVLRLQVTGEMGGLEEGTKARRAARPRIQIMAAIMESTSVKPARVQFSPRTWASPHEVLWRAA